MLAPVAGVLMLAGCSSEAEPVTFADTLSDMTADFGEDARVVRYSDDGSDVVTWEVVTAEGTLHTRTYQRETSEITDSQANPRASERTESTDEREANADELRAELVTLGELDPGVLETMLAEADAEERYADSELRGTVWTIDPVGTPWEDYTARYDGGGLKKVKKSAFD